MSVKKCPRCGITIEDFRRTGLLGCAECYNVFREEILATVARVQGKTRHKGKLTVASEENYSLLLEQQLLKENIERAMREGDFERAEQLNRRLQESRRTRRGEDE